MNRTTAVAGEAADLTICTDKRTGDQMNKSNVLGLVLAGGLSTRMGQDKSRLCLRSTNQSLVEHAHNLLSNVCNGRVIVSGKGAEQIQDVYPECGPLAGIHAGFMYAINQHSQGVKPATAEQFSALLVTPVDMPSLTAQTLTLLIENAQKNSSLAYFEGFNLPLYVPLHRSIFQYLARVLQDRSALSIFRMLEMNHGHAISIPDTVNMDEFINVNSPKQWHKLNTNSVNI
ncbi:putative molybdenum cofactor guanylyltransferase [Paraglaciecola mesophila]|uniref:Putative molybdenum cofactor guanylyltransferase n=1 Tax=Paraglaciecola mesophila TaxID=197222 RepID=A0A857JGV6_9ALTE|nr:molybdenum cofactor guanylyltransferase [Paraglaciecola mesophila]QHJ10201.1 putative molybdenum cofactor guanylyltransferase [Paraglaciecola mesophila]